MMQTEKPEIIGQTELKGKLLTAYEYLIEHKNAESAQKVKQLAAKLVNGEFTIAFCGHFSAGKSKMINRLVGENLLPSSPIPTSANLVKVRMGEESVRVFFKNEKPRLYLAPYDYQMIKNYCKDGDQIREIEISHECSSLPEKTVIMDTPGIDSADDAHRLSTESAIHLADLIFYVMDYNHVQSELNFMFTKELTEAGKEVCLVINQIDKHSSQELSFEEFRQSAASSFASWGVEPKHIFYTSLKEQEHPHNEFAALQSFLTNRLDQKDELLLASILKSLGKIMKDHFAVEDKKAEQQLEPCQALLAELPDHERTILAERYLELKEERAALSEPVQTVENEFLAGIDKILSSAYLMPFQTRSLAENYLAACESGFKVGLFFTKQKTMEERQRRLDAFYAEIQEKTKSQVEWHIKEFLLSYLKEKKIDSKVLLDTVEQFEVVFTSEVLTSATKEGARLSGEYLLNYTDDVASEIKRTARGALTLFRRELLEAIEVRNAAAQKKIKEKLAGMERYIEAVEQIRQVQEMNRLEEDRFAKSFVQTDAAIDDKLGLFVIDKLKYEIIEGQGQPVLKEKIEKQELLAESVVETVLVKEQLNGDRLKHTAMNLKKSAQLLQALPGFQKISRELEDKAQRLENKGFTVALFGAFSAGKSSFANALLGDSVLPVSPNPMTAAINKIKPVEPGYEHGQVIVKLKAAEVMLDDVNQALQLFGFMARSLQEAAEIAEGLDGSLGRQGAVEKTNYTFLQAFARGFVSFVDKMGEALSTTLEDFGDYVAKEEKSCFVEWIDLYYDCALTRKGITLVDTPGADSINARHTDVAFDFIKNSDAILFITYYNHAFSKADREFLIQLGRVKDAFQLDKMFFLINAIDLADNDEEKDSVIDYVRTQLTKYGVKNPHLYALSSLLALGEKQQGREDIISGMAAFERAFYHFITYDLANMAAMASENELQRVHGLLGRLVLSARDDAAGKQKKRENIETEKNAIGEILGEIYADNLKKRLSQECEELVYYIKQRVFLRFNEFFKESFNPSVLRDDGRNLKKVLKEALHELLSQMGFDFSQELRATTVRLDYFAGKILAQQQTELEAKIAEINTDISFSAFVYHEKAQIHFEAAFAGLSPGKFTKAMTYFKTPKSFFEKNESRLMSEELQRVLSDEADGYLAEQKKRIQALYEHMMGKSCEEFSLRMQQEQEDFYLSLLSALDGGLSAEALTKLQEKLKNMITADA